MAESFKTCPSCGTKISPKTECRDMYNELSLYTLSLRGPGFIHQYIVDAYAAQHARENNKPIVTVAALIGLYYFAEKNYSGKKVQKVHMILGNKMKLWPLFLSPKDKATLTVMDVLTTPAGAERDQKINDWARSVWGIWKDEHMKIEQLLQNV